METKRIWLSAYFKDVQRERKWKDCSTTNLNAGVTQINLSYRQQLIQSEGKTREKIKTYKNIYCAHVWSLIIPDGLFLLYITIEEKKVY